MHVQVLRNHYKIIKSYNVVEKYDDSDISWTNDIIKLMSFMFYNDFTNL